MTAALELHHGAWVVALAVGLDMLFGEPPTAVHPVVLMGRAVRPLTRVKSRGAFVDLALGTAYVLFVIAFFAGATWALRRYVLPRGWPLLAFDVYLVWSCFALRLLVDAGTALRRALSEADIEGARRCLWSLCSRDPSALDERELAGAAIESLSENASDSVVAPLFYYALFGVPGIVVYRATNTFDAMVGYHGRFEYLGKSAAKLDDALNLLPARLCTLLLWLAGGVLRLDVRRGLAIWWRDHERTESPNAGHPMAMAAGLLGVCLDKRGAYTLGEGGEAADRDALRRAETLTKTTGWLACALTVFMLAALGGPFVD